jgi:choline monooxygenase
MIDADIARAKTLPSEFYRDPALFERLRERVLARAWQWVTGSELPLEPGSARPFALLPGCVDEPLLLTRDSGGALRALSNVCTHRGNLLCPGPETAQTLRCRYHGRRFSLDGKFLTMPEFGGAADFPAAEDDLPQIPLRKLGPMAFASLDPAMPFEDWMAPVRERMAFLPWEKLVFDPAGSRAYEVAANWLLYCDSYLEGFHIPFVHPALYQAVDFGTYRTELFDGSSLQVAEAVRREDAFDGSQVAGYYFFLFPNTLLNFYPWGLSMNIVVPLAPDRTRIVYRTFVLDASRRAGGAGGDLDKVEKEDEEIVEQVQRGMASRLYRRGRYSPGRETGPHHFHRLLLRALE